MSRYKGIWIAPLGLSASRAARELFSYSASSSGSRGAAYPTENIGASTGVCCGRLEGWGATKRRRSERFIYTAFNVFKAN